MKNAIINWIKGFYGKNVNFDSVSFNSDSWMWTLGLLLCLILASTLVWFISRFILIKIMSVVADRTDAKWDDHLVDNKVFKGLALMVPLAFMDYFLSIVFFNSPNIEIYSGKIVMILILIASIIIVNRFFNAIKDILGDIKSFQDKPINSYTQILKIIFSGILIIGILSVFTNKSPVFFLTSLGAISAVLLLIFRDTILGFVGSIQLASYDMIRTGDWVTMEKYGADGDVQEINLTTVKVRNFDRTITTIPTYAFISDSFKNWRGMQESDGRRIKRSIKIQIDSVHFASDDLIEKLSKIPALESFIKKRQTEIEEFNQGKGLEGDLSIYGRRQTNIGLFRQYISYYLENSSNINQDMTLMVRQLEPTELGVPLEIYCFTKDKEWGIYEEVVADIFDHILAIIREFELRNFERPTGHDFKN
ncbi:MAG: mechanosensitive ion channel family protein [Crocinitomicaceae bacterium]|nr:mechanosensitive ion channel family protein [Crocinitomicaceae bacterium]